MKSINGAIKHLITRYNRRYEMKKYRCSVCAYIYEPDAGDPDEGIDPGTSFNDLPDDWVCPDCGADKSFFEEA